MFKCKNQGHTLGHNLMVAHNVIGFFRHEFLIASLASRFSYYLS